jgi:hypothetical protein
MYDDWQIIYWELNATNNIITNVKNVFCFETFNGKCNGRNHLLTSVKYKMGSHSEI